MPSQSPSPSNRPRPSEELAAVYFSILTLLDKRRGPRIALVSLALLVGAVLISISCSREATPTPDSVQVVIDSVVLPTSVLIDSSASGLDDQGNVVHATDGALKVVETEQGTKITLPISLEEDSSLESFSDEVSGIQVTRLAEGLVVEIPVRDRAGNRQVTIRIYSQELRGTGNTVEGEIQRMELETVERQVDFSSIDSEVGLASIGLLAELKRLPPNASLSVAISKEPEPDAETAFSASVEAINATIDDTAYVVSVEKVNLEDGRDVGNTVLTLRVGQAWTKRHGLEGIRAVRLRETGESQLLDTRFVRLDSQGRSVFEVISPGGLSVFGLVALHTAPEPTPTPSGTPPATSPTPTPPADTTLSGTFTPSPTQPAIPTSTPIPMSTPTLTPAPTPIISPTPSSSP
ncbi:MAG: hypothetical protein ACE5KI_06150, partial [Dehalococcoidia bacterium]